MPKPKVVTAGFVTSDAYLTVHFTVRWQTSIRYLEAKVRLSDLAQDPQFNAALQKTHVRMFRSYWEADDPFPLALADETGDVPPWQGCAADCRGCENPAHDD